MQQLVLGQQQIAQGQQQIAQEQRRVQVAPPVRVSRFNYASDFFFDQSSCSLAQLLRASIRHFNIAGEVPMARFYSFPSEGNGEHVTFRQEQEWRDHVDACIAAGQTAALSIIFVCEEGSPPPSMPGTPPSPPQVPGSPQNSEPERDTEVEQRDNNACVICGETSNPQLAHVVDKSRPEMVEGLGIPNNDVNSRLNMMLLCANHHGNFDKFEFALVPTSSDAHCDQFRITPVTAAGASHTVAASLRALFHRVVTLHSIAGLQHPPPHLFLVKLLLRFELPCSHCGMLCKPNGYWAHVAKTHGRTENDRYPLPKPCSCDVVLDTPTELYKHMVKDREHLKLLYYIGEKDVPH
jgi:hypothetical protein